MTHIPPNVPNHAVAAAPANLNRTPYDLLRDARVVDGSEILRNLGMLYRNREQIGVMLTEVLGRLPERRDESSQIANALVFYHLLDESAIRKLDLATRRDAAPPYFRDDLKRILMLESGFGNSPQARTMSRALLVSAWTKLQPHGVRLLKEHLRTSSLLNIHALLERQYESTVTSDNTDLLMPIEIPGEVDTPRRWGAGSLHGAGSPGSPYYFDQAPHSGQLPADFDAVMRSPHVSTAIAGDPFVESLHPAAINIVVFWNDRKDDGNRVQSASLFKFRNISDIEGHLKNALTGLGGETLSIDSVSFLFNENGLETQIEIDIERETPQALRHYLNNVIAANMLKRFSADIETRFNAYPFYSRTDRTTSPFQTPQDLLPANKLVRVDPGRCLIHVYDG